MTPSSVNLKNHEHLLRDLAADRYSEHLKEIERSKNGIYHNRKGQLSLASITTDEDRMKKRLAREALPPERALERINGVPNFQDVSVIKKIVRSADTVCRIIVPNSYGSSSYGTGFLIGGNTLITNNHVIPDIATAKRSVAQWNYELDEHGAISTPFTFKLKPEAFFVTSTYIKDPYEPYSGLDFTIVAVEEFNSNGTPLSNFGFSKLDGKLGKIIEGESCIVIQHPAGDYKKIVLKDIRMITLTEDFLIYESDTLPGSSGSMVVGQGTGEIVALHHSGVPRKDAAGNWLRKDGTRVQANDSDDQIDWIGNEGIRISRIINAVQNLEVEPEMLQIKQLLLEHQTPAIHLSGPSEKISNVNSGINRKPDQAGIGHTKVYGEEKEQYFEVIITDNHTFREDWDQKAYDLVKGLTEMEKLLPEGFDPVSQQIYYLTIKSSEHPWQIAAQLEQLPHIEYCFPDLPVATDAVLHEPNEAGSKGVLESGVFNDGTGTWDEKGFMTKWEDAEWFKRTSNGNGSKEFRWWNWHAVNFSRKNRPSNWNILKKNISKLRLVQLDTGYTRHTKVFDSYDLTQDIDFINKNDFDALDEVDPGILKHPHHGTRTASLVVGGKIKDDPKGYDGNNGLLTENAQALLKLIPYRIANSVFLIGRVKGLVNAVRHAINTSSDVIFMCMGIYPRPILDSLAREAYESGVIWVCAAGNEVEMVVAPALYPGTIAVAAINPNDKPWKGSSYGHMVDIAAPGEDVYVPFLDKDRKEIMSYGNGTSYATPHVASAALLWKARHLQKLNTIYDYPWQIVEAFRYCLEATARIPQGWDGKQYGKGILDIENLLNCKLPEQADLKHAYKGKAWPKKSDLGIREATLFLWNTLKRKLNIARAEAFETNLPLTPRGKLALEALTKAPYSKEMKEPAFSNPMEDQKAKEALKQYFNQY